MILYLTDTSNSLLTKTNLNNFWKNVKNFKNLRFALKKEDLMNIGSLITFNKHNSCFDLKCGQYIERIIFLIVFYIEFSFIVHF